MNRHDWLTRPALDDTFPLPTDRPFTYGQARAVGLSRRWLLKLREAGLLAHPLKGVYVSTTVPDSIRLRAACLKLVMPPDAVVCDRHAGWLHGAEMVLLPNEHLHRAGLTLFLPAGRGRLRNALTDGGERTFRRDDIVEVHGLRATTPLRTALDLGRHRFIEPALSAMDALLRLEQFSQEELLDGVERFRGQRWVTTLRRWAPFADARAESPGESALRLRCWEVGLPTMVPQYEVTSRGRIARLDLGEPAVRFAAEYDGKEWHTERAGCLATTSLGVRGWRRTTDGPSGPSAPRKSTGAHAPSTRCSGKGMPQRRRGFSRCMSEQTSRLGTIHVSRRADSAPLR